MTIERLDLNPGDSIVLNNTSGNIIMQYFRKRAHNPGSEENEILCALLESKVHNHNKHETEQKYPEQCKFFRDTIEEMYTVMLKKNLDYSPYNIMVTGMRGLVTRLWDKSARFFSLMGLDIGTGEWSEPREPENESIDQNLIDWANYCIIARIFREGKWAK